jgi:hypothetical protein
MDLISFLATHFLEETTGGGTAAPESDSRLQQFEFLLGREGPREADLLRAYLDLSVEELDALSPDVHEWFLERLALRPPAQLERDPRSVARQAGRLFFLSGRSTQRYLAISALLALDEWTEARERSSVAFVWDGVWNDEGLTDAEKDDAIAAVAEMLLDQHYFSRESPYPLRALEQLLRSERERRAEAGPARAGITARADLVGGTLGRQLASLLREA